MEGNALFLTELIGKTIAIQMKGGSGIREGNVLTGGDYKGTLLGFDGTFLKLEYEVSRFANGENEI